MILSNTLITMSKLDNNTELSDNGESIIYYYNDLPINSTHIKHLHYKYKFNNICVVIESKHNRLKPDFKLSKLPDKINYIEIFSYDEYYGFYPPNKLTPNNIEMKLFCILIDSFKFLQTHIDNLTISGCRFSNIDIFKSLPKCISSLKLLYLEDFNDPIDLSNSSIKSLELKNLSKFNKPLNLLPSRLKKLKLHNLSSFNNPLDLLPVNLESLELIDLNEFNSSLDLLPISLKYLSFGSYSFCDGQIKSLPKNLDTVKLINCCKSENILKFIPTNLNYLIMRLCSQEFINKFMGYKYLNSEIKYSYISLNKLLYNEKKIKLDNILPENFKNLIIDGDYLIKKNIFNITSTNIQNLTLGNSFNYPIDNLQSSLQSLTLGSSFNYPVNNLPSSLKSLTLGDSFNHPIDNLPLSLQSLTLGDSFNHLIDNLPLSLQSLTLGDSFNHLIDNLPSSLESLTLGASFNNPIDNLPSRIKYLNLTGCFNHPVDNLPISLIELVIADTDDANSDFEQPIKCLPNNLRTLKIISDNFNHPISDILPNKLIELELGNSFNHPLNLSSKIKKLKIHNNKYDKTYSFK